MIAHEGPGNKLRENAAGVSEQLVRGVDAAGDGAVLKELRLHFVDRANESSRSVAVAAAVNESVAIESPLGEVGHGSAHGLARLVVGAVLAHAVGFAIAVNCLVILARFLWKAVLLHVVEHDAGVAAAAARFTAVEDDLWQIEMSHIFIHFQLFIFVAKWSRQIPVIFHSFSNFQFVVKMASNVCAFFDAFTRLI